MKTIWFYKRHNPVVRRIWAGIYGAERVRRAQWTQALVTAIAALDAVAPMVEDKDTGLYIAQQLEELERQVERW